MSNTKIKILYLDDEENNLFSFKAVFRNSFEVFLAQNVPAAEKVLEANNDIQIVISDQRMPGVTGIEYFEHIRVKFPKPVRILITAYTDIESVINAINRGHVFRYIRKPWDETEMRSAFEEAHRFYNATNLLHQKENEIQEAYKELSKFAYSVTHEIKGPLISIHETLKIATNPNEQDTNKQELLGLAINSTNKLLGFVERMFDYYRLKQGELTIEEIDLERLANEYKEIYSAEVKLNNIDFTVEVKNGGQAFRSDLTKIHIIINNLLSNAFKYRNKEKDKQHRVNLELVNHSGTLTISVSDNGVGIKEKYMNNIFDMFYRANSQEPGSGFGLYNMKDAVSKINGNIEVNSTFEKGSVFTVHIPSK